VPPLAHREPTVVVTRPHISEPCAQGRASLGLQRDATGRSATAIGTFGGASLEAPRRPCGWHHVAMTSHDLAIAMRKFDDAVQLRDRGLAEEVLDDDYALVLVHPAPATMPRDRWLEVLDDYMVHSYSVEEQRVDRSDVVATVLSKVQMQATVLGQDRSGLFVISDVWRRGSDGWRVWRRHSSPLTAGEMPGARPHG
jgi:ketosteroid isomerase-like protein